MSADVPFEYLKAEIIDVVSSSAGRRHVWMWLTKQPLRMAAFSLWLKDAGIGWPANLWPGTSITRQSTVARAKSILRVGNGDTTHFVSVEPMLSQIDFTLTKVHPNPLLQWQCPRCDAAIISRACPICGSEGHRRIALKLVIGGGESGPEARPCHPDWARRLRDDCIRAGVPFFWKQWGEFAPYDNRVHPQFDPRGPAPARLVRVATDGALRPDIYHRDYSDAIMIRVGKKDAGRRLDGRTWDEFPQSEVRP